MENQQPLFMILENVLGMTKKRTGETSPLDSFIALSRERTGDMYAAGYVLSCNSRLTPIARPRVYCVFVHKDVPQNKKVLQQILEGVTHVMQSQELRALTLKECVLPTSEIQKSLVDREAANSLRFSNCVVWKSDVSRDTNYESRSE